MESVSTRSWLIVCCWAGKSTGVFRAVWKVCILCLSIPMGGQQWEHRHGPWGHAPRCCHPACEKACGEPGLRMQVVVKELRGLRRASEVAAQIPPHLVKKLVTSLQRGLEAGWQFLPVGLELSSPGQSENTRSKYEKCSATKEDILETCASQQLRSDHTDTPWCFWPQPQTAGRGCLTFHFKRGQGDVKWLVFLPVSLLVYTLSRFTKAFGKCLRWITGCHCLSKEVQHTGWAFKGGKNPDPKN